MRILVIAPAVVSLASSVLAYGRLLGHYAEHADATEPPPSDVMTEIDAILDKLFNTSSTTSDPTNPPSSDPTHPATSDPTDPWANIKIDPYMAISNDDKWCPHGEGNYCGEYVGKDPSILWHCSVYNGQAHWSKESDCSKGCKLQPAEYDDHCEAESDCPHGDGMYCGRTLGKDLHHLYRCSGGVIKDMGYCPNGCEKTPDGTSDYCRYVSGNVSGFNINALSVQKLKTHIGYKANMNQRHDYVCQGISVPVNETVATQLLAEDVKNVSTCVCDAVRGKNLTDNQYGALVDYVYTESDCKGVQSKSIDLSSSPSDLFGDDSWGQDLSGLWSQSSEQPSPC
ncbi:hypothetical protein Unana1_00747 [Umbelopsis nana]